MIRRLSIDLIGKLPTLDQLDQYESESTSTEDITVGYLASNLSAKTLADRHLNIWKLDLNLTPDLSYFAKTDTTLSTKLTASTQQNILSEPIYVLRFLLENKKPYSDLYTIPWSILHDDALDVWTESSSSSPWAGEPLKFHIHTDNRPAMGILGSHGFNAAIHTGEEDNMYTYSASVLSKTSCIEYKEYDSHLLYELSSNDFNDDGLTKYAGTNKNCASCHKQFQNPAPDFAGNARGSDLSEWLSYSDSTETTDSIFSGKAYQGPAELAKLIANDPRTHMCEIKKLVENILQRPLQTHRDDQNLLAALNKTYYQQGQDLTEIVKKLSLSASYGSKIQDKSTKKRILGLHSGVKYLTAASWKTILQTISPSTSSLTYPNSLTPGIYDQVDAENFIPSGDYYHQIQRLSRLASTTIINDELSDNRSASSRRLLTQLPPGSGYSATSSVIDAQIVNLWKKLTAKTITTSSTDFTRFKTLWTAASNAESSTDNKSRKAWQTLLIGMMLSPEFYMY
jgi:hypothetical protein